MRNRFSGGDAGLDTRITPNQIVRVRRGIRWGLLRNYFVSCYSVSFQGISFQGLASFRQRGLIIFALAEFEEQRDDGVQDDALRGQQFSHVEYELLGRNAFAVLVLLLERSDRQLPFGGGLH